MSTTQQSKIPAWWPPKGSSKQFRVEKRMWAATMPLTIAWNVFLPKSWASLGTQVIAQLSIYALVKGAGGQEQAAEAKETAAAVGEAAQESRED
jgi:hypothetical protein